MRWVRRSFEVEALARLHGESGTVQGEGDTRVLKVAAEDGMEQGFLSSSSL